VEKIPKINFSINMLGTFSKMAKMSVKAKILNKQMDRTSNFVP
jgi:hypothetical protein